jgi:alkanesulfonate monooxygenase SsuD/methylene tetrahydromethanopterin reductase-like flavin-dependent oxidoreductase (luciferase family)
VPILVGGSGERVTLKLVARYADACNLFGDPGTVRHKVEVLHAHCAAADRDPAEVTVTNLSTADAPSVEDHVGRYRQYAEAGVEQAIVNFPGLEGPEPVAAFNRVIAAFRPA